MPDTPPTSSLSVYRLRVVLRGVSPLIWRRLLVRSDSSIADLHYTLQVAFGWSDEHLNRFVVHGREYGVAHPGGLWFRDDPDEVQTCRSRPARRRTVPGGRGGPEPELAVASWRGRVRFKAYPPQHGHEGEAGSSH